MGNYSKGLAALFGGIVTALASFGIVVPEGIQTMVTTAMPLLTAALVYFVPNKPA